ncbi:MAG: hypothetical protein C0616_12110 [Desulfuromonas sp.]|nr:MAG: hypothetical protein C0616_12110 [Desulfuromonas sp.]
MGKKNRSSRIPKFKSDPFKSLKGFAVSSANPSSKEVEPNIEPEPVDDLDFTAAMHGLGVSQIENDVQGSAEEDAESKPVSQEQPEDERQLFLQALGSLDKMFKDEVPEKGEASIGGARRMKMLRQGKLKVEAELDLHGMERIEARRRTLLFLENALHQGWRTVRVITGQGHHSSAGPVLRDTIERLLRDESPRQVLEWGRAPVRHGGAGALILFLRTNMSRDEGGKE